MKYSIVVVLFCCLVGCGGGGGSSSGSSSSSTPVSPVPVGPSVGELPAPVLHIN